MGLRAYKEQLDLISNKIDGYVPISTFSRVAMLVNEKADKTAVVALQQSLELLTS